jgi:hypothetical protein
MRAIFLIHLRQVIRDKDWGYPVFLLCFVRSWASTWHRPTTIRPWFIRPGPRRFGCPRGMLDLLGRLRDGQAWFDQRQSHLREFWKSLGVGDSGYSLALLAIPNLLNAALFLSAALLSIFTGAQPGTPFW